MKTLSAVLISLTLLISSSCDFDSFLGKADKYEIAGEKSLATADPIVTALENAIPGWEGMDVEKQDRIVQACQKAVIGGEKLDKVLTLIKTFAPSTKPFMDGAQGIIGLLSSALLSVGVFIKHRKAKTAEKVAVAQMVAGEDVGGFGRLAKTASINMGIGKEAEALYQSNFKA